MPLYVLPFPAFNPVLISFGPVAVRWYALAYIVGILLGWLYVRTLIKRDFERVFADGVDAILTPATPSAAFGIGEKGSDNPVEMYLNDVFTVTVNMAGLPGLVVPGGLASDGLPLGLQLIGRPFDEETLFSLGEVLEQAAGRFTPPRWW